MQNFGGQIDAALRGDSFSCLDAVVTYDTVAAAPTFDVAGTDLDIQNAYGQYRASIDIFMNGTRDMVGNCRELITGDKESTTIPFQQWGLARQEVDSAIGVLSPAIVLLGGED